MKYWLILTLSIFGLFVACGKKDNKRGQTGQAGNGVAETKLNCSGSDKEKKECESKKSTDTGVENAGTEPVVPNGSDKPEQATSTIPNLKSNLDSMILSLSNNTSLVMNGRVSVSDNNFMPINFICAENLFREKEKIVISNPDELPLDNQISVFLFQDGLMAVQARVEKGSSMPDGQTKSYIFNCTQGKNLNEYVVATQSTPEVDRKVLAAGQFSIEYISSDKSSGSGVMASFECGSKDILVGRESKILGGKVINRIKLASGSGVLVARATDAKVGDKVLKEMSTAKKQVTHSLIVCK